MNRSLLFRSHCFHWAQLNRCSRSGLSRCWTSGGSNGIAQNRIFSTSSDRRLTTTTNNFAQMSFVQSFTPYVQNRVGGVWFKSLSHVVWQMERCSFYAAAALYRGRLALQCLVINGLRLFLLLQHLQLAWSKTTQKYNLFSHTQSCLRSFQGPSQCKCQGDPVIWQRYSRSVKRWQWRHELRSLLERVEYWESSLDIQITPRKRHWVLAKVTPTALQSDKSLYHGKQYIC